MDRYQAD